ncbi:elongation factor P hydroxylase [uncultured Umboniibacter sp.]|uniref:elongation factor P hydroxylase n=1 Tax=uncultured Umboniibacter sp. TaxID=1798917 RepID=UPI0026116F09|nr:elongation factor P hydroxylase [uncultured Umboniibacter sp.]
MSLDNRLSPSIVPSRVDLRICEVFAEVFSFSHNTELLGGADEPLYLPAKNSSPARIYYRLDYERSALHEIAHWCIAGEQRRSQADYGYWYTPDGRCAQQQEKFVEVEAKPQAVEWFLSVAAGLKFGVSTDNLAHPNDPTALKDAVYNQLQDYVATAFPPRAQQIAEALAAVFGGEIICSASLPDRIELN